MCHRGLRLGWCVRWWLARSSHILARSAATLVMFAGHAAVEPGLMYYCDNRPITQPPARPSAQYALQTFAAVGNQFGAPSAGSHRGHTAVDSTGGTDMGGSSSEVPYASGAAGSAPPPFGAPAARDSRVGASHEGAQAWLPPSKSLGARQCGTSPDCTSLDLDAPGMGGAFVHADGPPPQALRRKRDEHDECEVYAAEADMEGGEALPAGGDGLHGVAQPIVRRVRRGRAGFSERGLTVLQELQASRADGMSASLSSSDGLHVRHPAELWSVVMWNGGISHGNVVAVAVADVYSLTVLHLSIVESSSPAVDVQESAVESAMAALASVAADAGFPAVDAPMPGLLKQAPANFSRFWALLSSSVGVPVAAGVERQLSLTPGLLERVRDAWNNDEAVHRHLGSEGAPIRRLVDGLRHLYCKDERRVAAGCGRSRVGGLPPLAGYGDAASAFDWGPR